MFDLDYPVALHGVLELCVSGSEVQLETYLPVWRTYRDSVLAEVNLRPTHHSSFQMNPIPG